MEFLQAGIIGLETLHTDFDNETEGIRLRIPFALRTVGAELENCLRRHILDDVYAAYSPISYPRRYNNPSFGTALPDAKNFDAEIRGGNVLIFSYEPSGEHSGTLADTLNYQDLVHKPAGAQPIKPHPANGDMLIRRLEQGVGYDWQPATPIPPRPFYDNFLNDAQNHVIIDAFVAGMKPYDVKATKNEVTFDGSERSYQTGAVFSPVVGV